MPTTEWNKETLYRLVREKLGDSLFIVVSNREPYIHSITGGEIGWSRPVGGLTEALDPVMRASRGTWVAQGTGDADRRAVDENNRVAVPPDEPQYTLRRVWLTEEEVEGFYFGFSNEAIWPLCHLTFTPPNYRADWWYTYKKVNRVFADAVISEIGGRPAVVLVQDYHFALLAAYLKDSSPSLTVGQFWHIPWPAYDVFRTCPWQEEMLTGMLGNDLIGFHTRAFADNFIEAVDRSLETDIDRERLKIVRQGATSYVASFPISVDFDGISEQAGSPEVAQEMENLCRELDLDGKIVGVGMDRMDYTKGIPQRLMALERFLEENPAYRGRVVFVQAGMPSRTRIDAYRDVGQRSADLINRINNRFGTGSWQPVISMSRQLSAVTMNALRRLASFCIVSSLHDGMNLVAKEYAAARIDGDGVLILSRFTGAAAEMREALLINPYDIEGFAAAIREAVEMPEAERRRRMENLRRTVATNNIYRWAGDMVSRLVSIKGY